MTILSEDRTSTTASSSLAIAVAAHNVVVTGCGRVYVFPSGTPANARAAGLDHFEFREGYVDGSGDRWTARNIGFKPFSGGHPSRLHAIDAVVRAGGFRVAGIELPFIRHEETRLRISLREMAGSERLTVMIRPDGLVYGQNTALDRRGRMIGTTVELGYLWNSAERWCYQRPNSFTSSSLQSRAGALQALISQSEYSIVA